MTPRVNVKPEVLVWARNRAALGVDELVIKFPKYKEWESGKAQPTLRQTEALAKYVHAPHGYFFLSNPPDESLQLPDFRTIDGKPIQRPSPDLFDTIRYCQRRQDWYQEFIRIDGDGPLSFVGAASTNDSTDTVAAEIRRSLDLDHKERGNTSDWTHALREIVEKVESLGVLVMVSGVVLNNTHRRLKPEEFRGFTLADEFAPLVFINGADAKAAQMFTLAHELAHVWLGKSGLSDSRPNVLPKNEIEVWCNKVAAETLVPLHALREEYRENETLRSEMSRLTRRFKVSTLVMLRRIYDLKVLTRKQFQDAYESEISQFRRRTGSGGRNFTTTLTARVGKRFARALITDTLEGRTSFRDAFRMLGISKTETFCKLATQLGIEHGLHS